ncbi:hypothetical protein [Streptomyces sp. TRM72054]|nr:hypothetical protein [Streptomyces sp. TRM72054]
MALGDDLVIVDAVDWAHMLRSAHPPPVLRRFHTAVLTVSV